MYSTLFRTNLVGVETGKGKKKPKRQAKAGRTEQTSVNPADGHPAVDVIQSFHELSRDRAPRSTGPSLFHGVHRTYSRPMSIIVSEVRACWCRSFSIVCFLSRHSRSVNDT